MKPVLIFGAGQVAEVFAEALAINNYTVAAFVVDERYMPEKQPEPSYFDVMAQRRNISFEKIREEYRPNEARFIVGMSFRGLNALRVGKFSAMFAKGYEPLTFVDQSARGTPSVKIGRGSFIMDGNVIQTGAEIGENCVLWSSNHVGHHSKIGNNVWISSGVVVSGGVEIGDNCFIGSGATIRDNIKIGRRCVIGAGAIIDRDCEDDGVYKPIATERSRVPSSRLRGI